MMAMVMTASRVSRTAFTNASINPPFRARQRPFGIDKTPAAILIQQRLHTLMQSRLRQRMGGDRPREKEKRQKKQELERHQAEAGLQHQADDQKPGAERVDDAGGMHARVDLGHANEPDSSRR